jgi:RNA polymerase sigma factor (sigma-70 family)
MIISQSIGTLKNQYPNAKDLEKQNRFLSMKEYEVLAKKMLKKHIRKYDNILSIKKLIASEEIISEIMNALMKADWSWDETKSKQSYYRSQHCKWAILDIVDRIINEPKNLINDTDVSSNSHENEYSVISMLADDSSGYMTQEQFEEDEEKEHNIKKVQSLIPKVLTKTQQKCVKLYFFDGLPVAKIAPQLGITPQRVYQIIEKSTKTLKEYVNVKIS